MEEWEAYQKVLRNSEARGIAKGIRDGTVGEARRMLLLLGRRRLGEPSAEVVATLEALTDVEKLEDLTVRMLEAASWQDLLS